MDEITYKSQDLEKDAHFNMYRRLPITLLQGQGVHVVDTEGKQYIDALAGIAVNSLGHAHPNLVNAIKEQAEKLIHISNIYYNVPQSSLAKLLTESARLDKVFFCNSGAEANEGAIKLARKYAFKKGKKGKIISMENCFHGRTMANIAMGHKKYQKGFSPIPSNFKQIPFNDIKAFDQQADQDVVAVFIEPVQGEGGINVTDKKYLQQVRKICDQRDILLVMDEIQCGMGRTGHLFAHQDYGVKPDILTLAKGLGGGIPIGAVLAKKEVAEAFDFGDHGTTFGGNPLACAAAIATLKTIISENLTQHAREIGDYAMDQLRQMAKRTKSIKQVRGKGLMIGIELAFEGKEVVLKMMEKGVLANVTAGKVIRFLPPLIISRDEMDQILKVFMEALQETEAKNG
ncbi:MAG: aspartate aminotransferase family protein [Candidatus Cyclobacteriaceae bacterium M3_2C_046]